MDEEGPMARNRTQTFTFRVSTDERRMIKTLAARWQRTESDTVRLLVRAAARSLALSTYESGAILSERNDENGRTP
jgi:uncharacterized protein (DUF1778 family)